MPKLFLRRNLEPFQKSLPNFLGAPSEERDSLDPGRGPAAVGFLAEGASGGKGAKTRGLQGLAAKLGIGGKRRRKAREERPRQKRDQARISRIMLRRDSLSE